MSTAVPASSVPMSASVTQTPSHDQDGHVVQLYTDDGFLLDVLSRFIGGAIAVGDAAVIIATKAHHEGLAQRLNARGMDTGKAIRQGRYVLLDARETVSKIMIDGLVDEARFADAIGGVLTRVRNAAYGRDCRIAVFGELVALLWAEGKPQDAIRVEQLWSKLAQQHSFSLLCAYPITGFNNERHIEPFLKMCAQHSHVVPSESYLGLSSAEERLRSIAHLQQKAQVLEKELALRQSLTEGLANTQDADELICVLVQKAIASIGTESGCAGVRHPEGLVCHKYFRKGEALPVDYCFPPGHGLPGWLILNKVPYVTNDASSDPHMRHELCEIYGVRSALSTPILDAGGEVIAFFEVHNKVDGSAFDAKDQQLLVLVAQIASVALQKALAHAGEMVLRRNEERFRLLVEAVQDYAIFTLDPEGHVSSWNSGAERIKGYKSAEIVGKHFSCFYPEADLRNGKPQWELEVAAKEGRFEDEGWRVRKDGSRFWANVIITAVRNDAGKLVGFGKVTRDVTERMQTQQALQKEVAERRQAEQRLRQLSVYLLRTQDEERRRIGRDLHDSLGQYLAVLKMKLDSVISLIGPKEDEVGQDIARCVRLTEDSIKEVRTLSYLLYPPLLDEMGLKSAIPWYLDGFSERSGIKTTFEVQTDFGRLSRDAELALFRVLQESLTNVHRHSGSRTADVRLSMNDGMGVLAVQDKGKGIPAGLLEKSSQDWMGALGVGLRGMNERMRQLGGRLELVSTEEGTTVNAIVPATEFQPCPSQPS